MARIATASPAARSGSTPPIFETYLEARQEANRRSTQDKVEGVVIRIAKSPYGKGYVLRYVPLELVSDPDLGQAAIETGGRLLYQDL